MYDKEESLESQYARPTASDGSSVLLAVLVAIVGITAVLAAWSGA